jgi:hypothetical protein
MLNLVLGGIAFAIAASMAGAALRLAGSQTLVGMIAAVTTAIAFLVLWNLRIHRQPHGLFLCCSLLSMGGAAVALGHALFVGDLLRVQTRFDAGPKVVTADRAERSGTVQREKSPAEPNAGAESDARFSAETPPQPEPSSVPRSPEWTARWRAAQAEATARYPALAIRESRENKSFVAAYQSLRKSNPAYFDDPEWPMNLSLALAERDGWERGDGIVEDRPTEPSPASPEIQDTGSEDRSESSQPASRLRPY